MSVSDISPYYVERFASAYETAKLVFGEVPLLASPRRQRKIRRWVELNYIDENEDLPPQVLEFVSDRATDMQFIYFLTSCRDLMRVRSEMREKLMGLYVKNFPPRVQNAFRSLFNDFPNCEDLFLRAAAGPEGAAVQDGAASPEGAAEQSGAAVPGGASHMEACITLFDCPAYSHRLILTDASPLPEGRWDCFSFEEGRLSFDDDLYSVSGSAVSYDDGSFKEFSISFKDAYLETVSYNAMETGFAGTPWLHLRAIANSIVEKCSLPGCQPNHLENVRLPLLKEMVSLFSMPVLQKAEEPEPPASGKHGTGIYSFSPSTENVPRPADLFPVRSFPLIKAVMEDLELKRPLALVEKLEKACSEGDGSAEGGSPGNYSGARAKRIRSIRLKLLSKLNMAECLPLWQRLYDVMAETQSSYPTQVEACCERRELLRIRNEIQKYAALAGFSGTYPDFTKRGSVGHIRLASAYGESYIIGGKRNSAFHLHCSEEYLGGRLLLTFWCGTELLKKGQEPAGIFSCMFNGRGTRFFDTAELEPGGFEASGDSGPDPLRQCDPDSLRQWVDVAAKKAQLAPLTKKERRRFDDRAGFGLIFITAFIIMGGLFACLMTAGLAVLLVIITVFAGQAASLPEMMSEMPWLLLFGMSWLLFGGIMGIITALTMRK